MKNKIKNLKFKIKNIVFSKEFIILLGILFVAAVLRLYKIREYLTFLGDQGRDVLVIKRMVMDGELTLLGPTTSVGSIFLGPLYYYLMTPFLILSHWDPVGPAYLVVLLSLGTIYLLYRLCRQYLTFGVFVVSAFLYATSPLVLIHSRFSWNPNGVPFFALLVIYALMKVVIDRKDRWLFVVGLSLGVLFQLHYLTLMFLPMVAVALWLRRFKIAWQYYLLLIFGIGITLSPFILFELRHQFPNTQTVLRFITKRQGSKNFDLQDFGKHVNDVFVRLFWRLVVVKNAEITKVFIISLFGGLFVWFKRIKKEGNGRIMTAFAIIMLWFGLALLAYGFYQGTVYDYYFVPVFPLPFILTGIFLTLTWNWKIVGKAITVMVLVLFIFFHFQLSPLRYEANNQVEQTKQIAQFVYDQTEGKPYNFALIADKNSDHAYRYFLELLGPKPLAIENPDMDPERKTVTEQLLIVCEEKVCQPLGHPLWEIAGYGRAEIAQEWDKGVVKIFKLVPYK